MADPPTLLEWDELAAWYDAKQGEDGDLWHRTLIDPVLLNRIGDVAGRDVLDLACGPGYLARRLRRAGARVTGVDGAPAMIARAERHEAELPLGILYLVAPASDLRGLADRGFDLVYANMALMDIEDAEGAIREAARVLRRFGRFVASFDHPCFGGDAATSWTFSGTGRPHARSTTISRTVHQYRAPYEDPGAWNLPEGRTGWTRAYHRSLAWYADAFRTAGFALTALDEPAGNPEFWASSPLGEAIRAFPLHLVVEALRLPDGAVDRPPTTDGRPGDPGSPGRDAVVGI
ncbi:MAG: class I SAM-dependent methyltransferase [Thermoplasmata archaeon]|nr:class I SAM-dependent methyltransferase [Thermoplasmata archaeon]